MRSAFPVLAVLALAACEPEIPDSAAGVGFGTYEEYSASRARALRDEGAVQPPVTAQGEGAAIAAETLATLNPGTQAADAQAAPRVVIDTDNPGISDEQNFAAVAARETIQSDRERLQAQRQQYTVIAPEPLPPRTGATGPNIVEYALGAPNRVGESRYRRSGLTREAAYLRNCAQYGSPDLAQEAFLKAGGPERDRLGLDPDGDGFACYWDPTPFRAAMR
ncbi:hypothetical protein [Rhodovulum euryhalinum]|uniref:Excalibur calcium-binding domain-containing protein n=1 Tax=Rhodovulum euryhalinum TaxID=35805 RepID=A0A4R2KCR7_9RHOB|nr:hypothetical protein [Rhodovulum euryhalinum]TCO69907.1 hypothetical protein EV655_11234 [Rhodovulum euryhalinum]